MVQQPDVIGREQSSSLPMPSTPLAAYETFGSYLLTKRNLLEITQEEFIERVNGYLFESRQPPFEKRMYGLLERNQCSPQVGELVPLLLALVDFSYEKLLPSIQPEEVQAFWQLAKTTILAKKRQKAQLSAREWDDLQEQLIALAKSRQHYRLYQVSRSDATSIVT